MHQSTKEPRNQGTKGTENPKMKNAAAGEGSRIFD